MDAKEVASRFKFATRNHVAEIVKDDGLYRHVKIASPRTFAYSFQLTTWPGYLAITGDCDDFVFSRLPDMFEFFRGDRPNPGYWAEKVCAESRSGIECYREDAAAAAIRWDMLSHIEGMSFSDARRAVAEWKDFMEFGFSVESEESAITSAMSYTCPVTDSRPFEDFWDHNLKVYTFGFLFACHAVQWGIKQYDLIKCGRTQADYDKRVLAGEL